MLLISAEPHVSLKLTHKERSGDHWPGASRGSTFLVPCTYQSLLALHYHNINIKYNFAQVKLVNDSTPFSKKVLWLCLKNNMYLSILLNRQHAITCNFHLFLQTEG